jgi:hypothetical protein
MSIEVGQIPAQEQAATDESIYGAANFEKLLLQGLSTDCTPCHDARDTYVREHALLLSVRTRGVAEAIHKLEEDILPCPHKYDNADIELAVRSLRGYNRA